MHPTKRSSLFAILFTFFIDNLGATIIFPLFAPLFLSPEQGIITKELPLEIRGILLGFFLAAFPLAQLFLTPLIGAYADRRGRKGALVITTALTALGYALCSWSISHHHLALLFLSRLLMGGASGNLSICLSALSDISSSEKEKLRYYSWGSLIGGVTFIIGPFLGGKLSDPNLNSLFSLSFPLLIGAGLCAINLLFLWVAFGETRVHAHEAHLNGIEGIQSVERAFTSPSIAKLYVIFFFYLIALNVLFQFLPAYMVRQFNASTSTIGDMAAMMGGCWVLGNLILSKWLIHRLPIKTIMLTCAVGFAVALLLAAYGPIYWQFILFLSVAVILFSWGWPLCTTLISRSAAPHVQGQVMGFSQSMQSLAMLIASFIGGPLLSTHLGTTLALSALFSLIYGTLVWIRRF